MQSRIKNSNKDRLTGAKFQAKGSFSPVEVGTWFNKLDANSKEFDLLNAKHHSYGYNDELNDLNDVLGKSSSVMDVFQNVSNTLGRVPQGVERSAILYHWRWENDILLCFALLTILPSIAFTESAFRPRSSGRALSTSFPRCIPFTRIFVKIFRTQRLGRCIRIPWNTSLSRR